MAWGRIDDKLYSHRKTMRIPRAHRCEAMGLWTLAISWSNNHGTDGYVPRDIWDEFGTSQDMSRLLVDAGYWIETDDGFLIANFSEYNLTSNDMLAKREAEAKRKRQWRDAKRARSGGSPVVVPTGQRDMSDEVPPDSVTTQSHTHTHKEEKTSSAAPPPSDTPPPPKPSSANRSRRSRDDEPLEFAAFWEVYPRRVDRKAAAAALVKALKQADIETILAGVRRYSDSCRGKKPEYIAHGATWLNKERWNDEEPSPVFGDSDGRSIHEWVDELMLEADTQEKSE